MMGRSDRLASAGRSFGSWALLVLLLCAAGCSGSVPRIPESSASPCPAVIRITNRSSAPVTVYAIGRGRVRIGTVGPARTLRRVLPPAVASEGSRLRLAVQQVAGALVITEVVSVEGGQEVRWDLWEPLAQSTVSLRVDHDPGRWAGAQEGSPCL